MVFANARPRVHLCAALVLAAMAALAGCSLAYIPAAGGGSTPQPGDVRATPASEPAESAPRTDPPPTDDRAENAPTVVHVVQPGQTLWRIARTYGVDLDRLADANGIIDATRVAAGTAIVIPGATRPLDVRAYGSPDPEPGERRAAPPPTSPAGFAWPIEGEIISPFGASRGGRRHKGIDIRGVHRAPVWAARPGRVIASGNGGRGYGLRVVIDHEDGFTTVYAHADELLVRIGEAIDGTTPIARVGRTGNATSDHLHFEIRRDGTAVDPASLLGGVLEARR